MSDPAPGDRRELAYYYPNPMWDMGDWIKNLVLFFDGIALLVPRYMALRPEAIDPAIVAGLKQHGLLEIIEPEMAVDKVATEQLATALTKIITSGALDGLDGENINFLEISMSRLGYRGDAGLARMMFKELKERGLALDSEDGYSMPMHPTVRSLILVLLSQILRPYGRIINANLNPVTDQPKMVSALSQLIALETEPSSGQVVEFDLNVVTVDLGAFAIDEVLDFRAQNLAAHRLYSLSVRKFAMELSRMTKEERIVSMDLRQAELNDLASDLRKRANTAWKKPASFALTLAGSAISVVTSPIAGILRLLAATAGYEKAGAVDAGAYSYLVKAHQQFRE